MSGKTKNSRPNWDRSIVYLRYHPNYRIIKHGHSLHILSYVRPVTEVSVAPKISPDDILGLPSWVHSQAYVSLPLHRPATLCHTVTGATTLTHRFNIFCVHYIRCKTVCQVFFWKNRKKEKNSAVAVLPQRKIVQKSSKTDYLISFLPSWKASPTRSVTL